MFDFVRKHTKMMMILLFLLIIPSFILFGSGWLSSGFQRGWRGVAKVAGHDITQAEWDAAHKNEVQRVMASSPGAYGRCRSCLIRPMRRYITLEKPGAGARAGGRGRQGAPRGTS